LETSLHRELKRLYAGEAAQCEVRLGRFRIDAIADGELIEVQHGPLAAIRDKVRKLLVEHRVRVVKPIIASKQLVYLRRKGGKVARRRLSPKRGKLLDLFDELIHFTNVFPHPRLVLEVPLVEVEERRYPGHGRRRWRRDGDYQVEDQQLLAVQSQIRLESAAELAALVSCPLPVPFHTAHVAAGLAIPRWSAQRIAYCLNRMGAWQQVGKARNAWLYERTRTKRDSAA
jgi:hypothetical protein